MAKKKLKVDVKSPKHYLEIRAFQLRKVLLWWSKKNYIELPCFKWLDICNTQALSHLCRVVNNHYFTSAEIHDLMKWKEDKRLMMVDYLVYFDILQCYLYIDRQQIEVDKKNTQIRKVHLRKLIDKYGI